jgi:DNA-binding SARP family transcriptional activator
MALDVRTPEGAVVRVRLCGEFAVELAGQRAEGRLRGRQSRLLFAYLLLQRGRAVSRDELIEALWPESHTDHGALLSSLLSRLRAALPEVELRGRKTLQLVLPAGAWVDVDAAVEALARTEAAMARGQWREAWGPAHVALAIAERPLLPGVDAPWLTPRRRELEELLADALECMALIGRRLGGSELAAAERAARKLIELAPLRESGHVALMELQAARGNAAQALTTYEDLRALLREELGTTPGAAARDVHARLLDPRAAPVAPPADLAEPLPAALRAPDATAFVGRRRELARLELSLGRAPELPAQLTLILGEPGIGKTRLLTHFGRLAHAAHAKVLYARADQDLVLPYSPLLDIVRAAGPDGSWPASEGDGDPALARLELFETVQARLADATGARPLVLLLDDLHWAEDSGLQLLRHLLRSPRGHGLLVVATARDHELERRRPLTDMLAELQRHVRVERLHLRGLAAPDVATLVREAAGGEVPEVATREIHASTDGNPFFVLELARHLAEREDAGALPESIRDVVLRRVGQLGDDAQRLLALGAVLGREFELGVLERVAGMPADAVLDALEEAVASRLLEEPAERPGRLLFAHALIRAVLYDRVSAARRTHLHERVAALLDDGASSSQLAYHLLSALPRGDVGRAVAEARRAAAEAAQLLAYEDAAEHLRGAALALDRHRPADSAQRLAVLLDLTDAERRAGRMPEARAAALEAIELAKRLDDPEALARATLGYGGAGFESAFVDDTMVALLEAALAAVGTGDSVLRVELLSRLAKALHYAQHPEAEARRDELSAAALTAATRLDEPRAILVALEGRHFALCRPDNLEERIEAAERIVALARELRDVERDLLGRYFLIADLVEAGQMERADAAIAEYGARAEESRSALHRWYHARFEAMRALLAGRFDDAARRAQEAAALGAAVEPRTAQMHFGTQMWVLHRELDRLGELEEAVRGFVAAYPAVPAWRCGLAWVLLAQDRRAEAERVFAEFAAARFANIPRDAIWSMTVALAAELAAAGLADRAGVRALHALMRPYGDRNAVTGEAIVSNGPMALYLGMTALSLGELDEAVAHLEAAVGSAARMGARPFELRGRLLLARAVGERGDRVRADAMAAAAEVERRRLGSAPPLM